jgi:hypothetical protein
MQDCTAGSALIDDSRAGTPTDILSRAARPSAAVAVSAVTAVCAGTLPAAEGESTTGVAAGDRDRDSGHGGQPAGAGPVQDHARLPSPAH